MVLRRVRALYVQPAPQFGGAERQAANNIPLLPSYGVDVLPFVGPGNAIVDWLRERSVTEFVHSKSFPGAWPKQSGLLRASLPWRYLRCGMDACADMTRLVGQHHIDVIIAALPFAWFTGSIVAREAGIPIIWRAGGTDVNAFQKLSLFLIAHGLRPDMLLCCADAVRRTFSPFVPAPVRVVQNGVDGDVFRPGAGDPRRFRPAGARRVIGCAIRLARSKRPQDFISLAARLRDSHPDVAFLLAGDGSLRPHLERLARDLNATNLSFLGYVDDMPSFYAACDLVVLPSRAEGCPNFLLESMSMGKVVVGTDAPGVLELVRDGESGVIYPIGDVGALAEKVTALLANDVLLHAIGVRGLERAQRVSARACARTIAELARGLVAANEKTSHSRVPMPAPRLQARSGVL